MFNGDTFFLSCRSEIQQFILDLRKSRNGSLSGMTLQQIVQGVIELILLSQSQHQVSVYVYLSVCAKYPCLTFGFILKLHCYM